MTWNYHDLEESQQEIDSKLAARPDLPNASNTQYRNRAIHNQLCTRRRREKRRLDVETRYANVRAATTHAEVTDPMVLCELRDTIGHLRRCVEDLPPKQRQVINAIYLLEQSVADACASLRLSPGAINSALSHARANLRRALTKGAGK